MFVDSMPLAVLTHLETYKFLQEQHTASLEASLLHEMAQIAITRGIALEDVAFFHAKTLSHLSLADTIAHLRHQGEQQASQAPTHKLSALQDLEQGKRLEVKEILGYAVRQSAARGIPTPTMDVCYKLIAGINHYL